jgi:hypothetical protein
MDDDWVVDLRDAVAVYRDYSGKLRVDQSYQARLPPEPWAAEPSAQRVVRWTPVGGRTSSASRTPS